MSMCIHCQEYGTCKFGCTFEEKPSDDKCPFCGYPTCDGNNCLNGLRHQLDEKDKEIERLKARNGSMEKHLHILHSTEANMRSYTLNPNTPSGLPMIPAEEKKE